MIHWYHIPYSCHVDDGNELDPKAYCRMYLGIHKSIDFTEAYTKRDARLLHAYINLYSTISNKIFYLASQLFL